MDTYKTNQNVMSMMRYLTLQRFHHQMLFSVIYGTPDFGRLISYVWVTVGVFH